MLLSRSAQGGCPADSGRATVERVTSFDCAPAVDAWRFCARQGIPERTELGTVCSSAVLAPFLSWLDDYFRKEQDLRLVEHANVHGPRATRRRRLWFEGARNASGKLFPVVVAGQVTVVEKEIFAVKGDKSKAFV